MRIPIGISEVGFCLFLFFASRIGSRKRERMRIEIRNREKKTCDFLYKQKERIRVLEEGNDPIGDREISERRS